ncbi:helix-turn-helix domain-containing protein [Pseudarthrobacter oxydans]|uniref:helix-turn-helix domain-containing protein n=1 Tax=Pseudarthrobacter oxydans TaxID=1671 RepID=UPI0034242E7C
MTAEANQHRFLTIAQVADELNVKQSLVQGLIRTGELRAFQVGGRGLWRIGRQDVEDYIEQAYRRTADRITAGELEVGTESRDPEQLIGT